MFAFGRPAVQTPEVAPVKVGSSGFFCGLSAVRPDRQLSSCSPVSFWNHPLPPHTPFCGIFRLVHVHLTRDELSRSAEAFVVLVTDNIGLTLRADVLVFIFRNFPMLDMAFLLLYSSDTLAELGECGRRPLLLLSSVTVIVMHLKYTKGGAVKKHFLLDIMAPVIGLFHWFISNIGYQPW